MIQKTRILTILLIIMSCRALAQISLPSVIGDNMVLQQLSTVPLWGNAKPDSWVRFSTSWDKKSYKVKAEPSGRWKLMINTPAFGGPYTITFTRPSKITIKNVLIGEVWLCSGQSNMEMPVAGFKSLPVLHSNDILTKAGRPALRLFHIQHGAANSPQTNCQGEWAISNPETAGTFSAVGFQFASMLQDVLNVPVGIIESDWGGTPIESWMPAASFAPFPSIALPLPDDSVKATQSHPTCLFNAMISPIAGFGIKGILWYQGEGNVRQPSNYDKLMEQMVDGWRKAWKKDSIFFYYVQIAPWRYPLNRRDSVPLLRQKQQEAQAQITNSGMVVSIDVGSEFSIHPPDKMTISKRLLYWALGDAYKIKGILYKSPQFLSYQNDQGVLTLNIANAAQGFTSYGQPINGFEIAGEDKVFYPAEAVIFKNRIQLKCEKVQKAVAIRYAYKDWVQGNLYNTADLPVAPFRTDTW